jgi:FlgD Ig-like domain/FG-GAP-like repeat/FG-GAP repeat
MRRILAVPGAALTAALMTLSTVTPMAATTPPPRTQQTSDGLHFMLHPGTEAPGVVWMQAPTASARIEPIGDNLRVVVHPVEAPSTSAVPQITRPTPFMPGAHENLRPLVHESGPDQVTQPASVNPLYGTWHSPNGIAGFGYSASGVGDVDADGYADFVVTTGSMGPNGAAAYLYRGGPSGPDRPSWQYETLPYPMKVSAAGDVNNDGYDDVLFSAAGRLYVFYGHSYGLGNSPDFNGSLNGFGSSAQTAGDVNGDGYADIIAGSYALSQVVIYFGSASGLSMPNCQFLTSYWGPSNDQYGYSVAGVGDMNGDGYGDVAIGAPDGYDGTGLVYFGFGSPTGISLPVSLAYGSGILGSYDYGLVVGPAGDLNGDGYADVMIADPTVGDGSGHTFGYAEIFGGGPGGSFIGLGGTTGNGGSSDHMGGDLFTAGDVNGDGLADALMTAPNGGYVRIRGLNASGYTSNLGTLTVGTSPGMTARTAGDVNGDGFSDILIAKPEGQGEVRLYYGAADPPSPSITHYPGSQDSGLRGWSVAMGDVNGDGYDDVVVGNSGWDGAAGADCGSIDLYLGGPGGLTASPVWTLEGFWASGTFGASLAAGQDVNGDGYGDILIGAPGANTATLIYGHADFVGDPVPQGWIYYGPDALVGSSVAFAGDVNGDGFADVLVGAPYYTDPSAPGVTHVGMVTLLFGAQHLVTGSSWAPMGDQADEQLGISVGAGDMNADGYSDIVIGTPHFGAPGITNEGLVQAFPGGPAGPSTSPMLALWGGLEWWVGNSVAGIGDFDRDGYGDVAFGCPGVNNLGRAYVVRGGPTTTWWYWDGTGWGFGNAVAPAGDVDGDGSSDLLVGNVFYDGVGGQDVGRMQVYPGGLQAGGPAIGTWEGVNIVDNLGHSVAGGGDVNGDGYADVVGGEPRVKTNAWDGGAFAIAMGNAARGAETVLGHARPTHQGRAFFPTLPIGIYGTSNNDTRFGITSMTSSPGGRDRVALEWRVNPNLGGSGSSQGRTPWYSMGSQTDPLHGARQIDATLSGLAPGNAYGWSVRQLSRSPYFRYGAWLNPQPNARDQWDIRTHSSPVAVEPTTRVTALEMSAPWPSPARGETHVAFALPRAGSADLAVRDVQGRLVRTLASGTLEAGRHEVTWNGSDASERPCAAGLYFLELRAAGERATQRIVLAR